MTPRRAPRPKWNDEKFPTDAPIDYSDEEAAAWAAGYNAARQAAAQSSREGRAGRDERVRLR
jgi:hypothetical protein